MINTLFKFDYTLDEINIYFRNIYDFNIPQASKLAFAKELIIDYKKFGMDVLKKISPDSIIFLYDVKRKYLLIKSDAIGHFVIYYCQTAGRLCFSENLKALARINNYGIDRESLAQYLILGYIPGERTIFKDIYKILPSSLFMYKKNLSTIRTYKQPSVKKCHSESFYINGLKSRFLSIIEQYATKDLGVMISGGVDSLILLSLAKKIKKSVKTFVIGIEPYHGNLFKHCKEVAQYFDTNHREIKISDVSYFESFEESIQLMVEPTYDLYVGFLRNFLFRINTDVRFLLHGSGADDLFCGEPRFLITHYKDLSKFNNKIKIAQSNKLNSIIRTVFENRIPGKLALQNKLNQNHYAKIVFPYLHNEIVQLAKSLPATLIVKNRQYKYILRKFAQGILPQRWALKKKETTLIPDLYKKVIIDSYYNFVEKSNYLNEILNKKVIHFNKNSIKLKLIIFYLWHKKMVESKI
ncbi:MAG: asparagine synthase (glutamine-hydrolysing) [Candidatus Berkelbacteria bacterium Licking1014_85]|uniref:asparagine synthase (glutamine-hydrolyzing) n=1 Tax=Candidatus Berkelbacteria bacterium Licking1014_85 TaxID=2017148 RepID=A0A554LL01_9BACT|nr:MAG: asparagine synthase (glutamine-hydrolysing) [Candidatus Berkelbacteria bacterium Licking1014_85]